MLVAIAQVIAAMSAPLRILMLRRLLSAISNLHDRSSVIAPLALFAVLLALAGYAKVVQREKGRLLGELVARGAVERVLDAAQATDLVCFEDSQFHDRISRAQLAQQRCGQALAAFLSVVGTALGAIGVLLLLTSVNWLLFPIAALTALPVAITSRFSSNDEYYFMHSMMPGERQRAYIESLLLNRQPAKEIRALGLAPFLRGIHSRLYDERIVLLRTLLRRHTRRSLWSTAIRSMTTGTLAGALLWLYISGRVSLATAGAISFAIVVLSGQLTGLSGSATKLYESLLFVAELDDFVANVPRAPRAAGSSLGSVPSFARVSMENVVFAYSTASKPAVAGVSLHVDSGEVVALVGPNGSGKTTVAKLLAGLYFPDRGRVTWNGVDTRDLDAPMVRDKIAIGFQDFERFRMSVFDNIATGRYERREHQQDVTTAADRAGASEFANRLSHGFATLLGPEFSGGHDLSQGQWQRLALARVLFRDAPLLILDEPTAALDPLAESELFEKISEALEGRGAVLISHRLSSVRMADRIYVLQQGQVIESGSHAELLAAGGLYTRLFTTQASAYMPAASEHHPHHRRVTDATREEVRVS